MVLDGTSDCGCGFASCLGCRKPLCMCVSNDRGDVRKTGGFDSVLFTGYNNRRKVYRTTEAERGWRAGGFNYLKDRNDITLTDRTAASVKERPELEAPA